MTTLRQAPPRIIVECTKCGRHGEYNRAKAIQQFGNINLDDFVFRIASAECALMKHPNQHRCGAHIPRRRAA
jgi:hypothetical protein